MNVGPAGGGGKRFRYMAEINMVPFIDIILVILIIFMVMTPMIVKRQIALNPPSSSSSDPDPSEKLRFDVQVDASGAAYVDGVPVPVANVMKALLDKGAGPDSMVSVGADRSLPFQKVVDVLDQVKAAGISKLSIEVVER